MINDCRPVFRVRRYASKVYDATYRLLFLAVQMLTWWFIPDFVGFFAGLLFASLVNEVWHWYWSHDVCSGPGCEEATLPRGVRVCKNCGGGIAGRIDDISQHRVAEERVRASLQRKAT